MIRLGFPAWTPSIAARIGAILSFAFSALPLTSNCTSTECRSREINPALGCSIGETMLVTSGCAASVCTTFATADENACVSAVAHDDWISTLSRAGILNFARSRICSAVRDSPFAIAHDFIWFAPPAPPTTTASTAREIQPKAARFQCAALQRPARPARFSALMTWPPARLVCPEHRPCGRLGHRENPADAVRGSTDLRRAEPTVEQRRQRRRDPLGAETEQLLAQVACADADHRDPGRIRGGDPGRRVRE